MLTDFRITMSQAAQEMRNPASELHLGCATWARTDIKIISSKSFAASRNACSSWGSCSWKQSSTGNPGKFLKMLSSKQITWIFYGWGGVAVWQVWLELVQELKVLWSPLELNHLPNSPDAVGCRHQALQSLLPFPAPEISSLQGGYLTNPIASNIFFLNIKIPEHSKMYLFLS